jgi:YD repeat-containing protein
MLYSNLKGRPVMKSKIILFSLFLITIAFGGPAFSATYTYDNANRLLSIDHGNGTVINYTYNAAGNRVSMTVEHLPVKIGVYVSGAWYLDTNANGVWDGTPADSYYLFGGAPGTVPVSGNWTGSATTKIGIFASGAWYLDTNGNGVWDDVPADSIYTFGDGLSGAVSVMGDWNGTGTTEIGVFADGAWYLDTNGNGLWDGAPSDSTYTFGNGLSGAVPITGDWNGTGTTKIGVYSGGYWYLDTNGNGVWDGTPADSYYFFGGAPGTVPVSGDWSGSGTSKIGIFVNGTWYLDYNGNGVWDDVPADSIYTFGTGLTGAAPVIGRWN